MAYLQLVDNPDFNPAFIRAVKVPAKGAGDKVSYSTSMTPDDWSTIRVKSLEEIASKAEKSKLSQLKLVEKIVDNLMPDTKPPIKKKLTTFVKIIRTLRDLNEEVFFSLPFVTEFLLTFGI